jgi:hypothetical protein
MGGFDWVWQFGLYPVDEKRTRLVSRSCVHSRIVWARLFMVALEPAAFLMTRRMLLGLQQRAEALAAAPGDPSKCAASGSSSSHDGVEVEGGSDAMPRKILLTFGVLSSLMYVAADVLAAMRYPEYHSFTSQTITELSAIGAPSRPLILPVLIAYGVLAVPFAVGVWQSARRNGPLRIAGGLLIGLGVVDWVGPFFPMHMRGTTAGMTLTDIMHITLTSVTVLLILLLIGFAAVAFGRRFRLYSIGTILVLVVFGALAGLDGPRIAANLPTPWVGVTERINVSSYLLWQVVLAIALLRARDTAAVASRADTLAA